MTESCAGKQGQDEGGHQSFQVVEATGQGERGREEEPGLAWFWLLALNCES